MIESRRLTIAYSGRSAGSGPLSVGQDNMVRCTLNDEPSDVNKQGAWPVPPGADVDTAVAALRTLAERHESLRTVYPGPAGRQPTEQTVLAEGAFELELVETDEDPAEVADRIGRRSRAVRFDLAAEFPLRLALITSGGKPALLSVTVCHAAADGAATGRLLEEWTALAAGRTLPPPDGPTPRQLAVQERSAAGTGRMRRSLRHWERILRTAPHAVFADSSVGPSEGLLTSRAVHSTAAAAALESAALRLGASPSAIMLAAYAALAAHRAAQRTVVIAALSSNRHRPGLADYVGTLAQDALIRLDADAGDFDRLVAGASGAAMTAYLHSTFESAAVWNLIDEAARQRGARFARHLVINDLSSIVPEMLTRVVPVLPQDPQLIPLPAERIPTRLMLNIWRLSGCVSFTLHADPLLFAPDEPDRFARGLLRLVAEAATRTVPLSELGELTGLSPAARTGHWQQFDGSWIDLAAVRELLRTALGEREIRLETEDGRLLARIAENDRPITPELVHRAVLDVLFRRRGTVGPDEEAWAANEPVGGALSGWETAMAPHWYVIHSGTPERPEADARDWSRLPVVAAGDGRGTAPDRMR